MTATGARSLKEMCDEIVQLQSEEQNYDAFTLFHLVSAWSHRLVVEIVRREQMGDDRDTIRQELTLARRIYAKEVWSRRLQEWPRGYQGDFETVEAMIEGAGRDYPTTVSAMMEKMVLNCAGTQQHRNKVVYQERLVRSHAERGHAIFSIACGGSVDAVNTLPSLLNNETTLYLNDIDSSAIALSRSRLSDLGERLQIVEGNVVSVLKRRDFPEFGLITAGGIFDYLPEKYARFVIRESLRKLGPDGEFFFTNILNGNPFRPWIEYMGNWELIERSEQSIFDLLESMEIGSDRISISRDQTGLAAYITISA